MKGISYVHVDLCGQGRERGGREIFNSRRGEMKCRNFLSGQNLGRLRRCSLVEIPYYPVSTAGRGWEEGDEVATFKVHPVSRELGKRKGESG